jgi:hypothetical protein
MHACMHRIGIVSYMHACMHRIDMFDVFVCYMHVCMHRIGMSDVFVCYMHVLDVICMDIYVFAILKCRD